MNPRKYGKGGEIATNRLDEQELYINTLMIQQVLNQPAWANKLTVADYRGLTPLFYQHINPYGTFRLDMNERIAFDQSTGVAS